MRQRGADCSVVAVKWSNAHGAKGAGHSRHAHMVNRQREEPTGCDGGRQLSMDGTSRVSREAQARICERLGVRLPGATRPRGAIPRGHSPRQVLRWIGKRVNAGVIRYYATVSPFESHFFAYGTLHQLKLRVAGRNPWPPAPLGIQRQTE
jgi:hypothetical protein